MDSPIVWRSGSELRSNWHERILVVCRWFCQRNGAGGLVVPLRPEAAARRAQGRCRACAAGEGRGDQGEAVIPVFLYKWIGIGVVMLVLGLAVWVQTERLDAVKAEYAGFVAKAEAIGREQEAAAKIKDAENKAKQEKANAENARTKSALTIALNSVRNTRPSGSFVPAAASGAVRPDLACYDRAEYSGATGRLVEGLRGLADESTAATIDLNTAKTWAQSSESVLK